MCLSKGGLGARARCLKVIRALKRGRGGSKEESMIISGARDGRVRKGSGLHAIGVVVFEVVLLGKSIQKYFGRYYFKSGYCLW